MRKSFLLIPLILSLNGCALLNTFLPKEPKSTAKPKASTPSVRPVNQTPAPLRPEAANYYWKYALAYEGETLAKSQPQVIHSSSGAVFTAGQHRLNFKKAGGFVSVLVLSRLGEKGQPVWITGFETDPNVQLGQMVEHQGFLYLSATVKDQELGGVVADHNLNLRDIVLAKLDVDGRVIWKKRFKMPKFNQPFANENQIMVVGPQELAFTYFNRVYFFDPQGQIRKGLELTGPIQGILKTPDGGYLANHLKIEKSNTIVSQGFQISALNPDYSNKWRKFYAANLKGLFTLSELHPLGNQRYHMAFALNDLSNSNPVGLGHLVFNAQGELESSFADLVTVGGAQLGFTQMHNSFVKDGAIYLHATHSGGRNAAGLVATFKYDLSGQFLAGRKSYQGLVSAQGSQLLSPLSESLLVEKETFHLAANDFHLAFCDATSAPTRRDFRLQVSEQTVEPFEAALPSEAEATLNPLPLEITYQTSACD